MVSVTPRNTPKFWLYKHDFLIDSFKQCFVSCSKVREYPHQEKASVQDMCGMLKVSLRWVVLPTPLLTSCGFDISRLALLHQSSPVNSICYPALNSRAPTAPPLLTTLYEFLVELPCGPEYVSVGWRWLILAKSILSLSLIKWDKIKAVKSWKKRRRTDCQ